MRQLERVAGSEVAALAKRLAEAPANT